MASHEHRYAFALKRAVAAMRDAGGGGAVVNIASISSFIAQPGFVPYSTTKGAAVGMCSMPRH
jgi:NAD(P)-dependent dehydrogenase (short-subunit alcohol dehydrogenase family)